MAFTFVIPRANPLRFLRVDNYESNSDTVDNLFYEDENFTNDTKVRQLQKFSNIKKGQLVGDLITTQLITNYNTITFGLYTLEGIQVGTNYTLEEKIVSSGNKTLQTNIDCTDKGGVYFVKVLASGVGFPTVEYHSEFFEVNNYSSLPYMQWYGSTSDGIYYDNTQVFGCRIEAKIDEMQIGVDSTVYEDVNFAPIVLRANVIRSFLISFVPLPRWQCEKLAIAFAHTNIYINDLRCAAKEKAEINSIEKSTLAELVATVYDSNFENYTDLISESENPEQPITSDLWIYTDDENDIVLYTDDLNDELKLV